MPTSHEGSESVSKPPSDQTRTVTGSPQAMWKIVFLAVSTALVFVVTRIAYVPISAFNGQVFDFGDILIFTFAWTFGPLIGGFAGGVGSFLSDASLLSPFAPFTLVIKGSEGLVAGYIARRRSAWGLRSSWLVASTVMVGGYFLTNWLALGYGFFVGLYEVPFDIMQVVAGGIIGRPVSRYLKNSLPMNIMSHKSPAAKALSHA